MKRAQAALEFMSTYGWTLLIIIAAVAAFSYYIGFDQSDKIPSTCNFGVEFGCGSFTASKDGTILYELTNHIGKTINLQYVQLDLPNGEKQILNYTGVVEAEISPGEMVVLKTYPNLFSGESLYSFDTKKEKILFTFYYRTNEEESLPKTAYGEMFVSILDMIDESVVGDPIFARAYRDSIFITSDGTRTTETIENGYIPPPPDPDPDPDPDPNPSN